MEIADEFRVGFIEGESGAGTRLEECEEVDDVAGWSQSVEGRDRATETRDRAFAETRPELPLLEGGAAIECRLPGRLEFPPN